MSRRERDGLKPTARRPRNNPREDPGKIMGEPIPYSGPPPRSIRGYQDGGRSTTEQRNIPTGFGAVIRDVPVDSDTPRKETIFVVQLGRIKAGIEREAVPREDSSLGFKQADRFEVFEGEHKGPILVVPMSLDKKYFIYVTFPGSAKPNENTQVTLKLIDRQGRIPRQATIPASLIMDEGGFDLDPTNPNNHGKELDRQHAQLFYEFETGQGQFSDKDAGSVALGPRRKMGRGGENRPVVIESTKETEFIDLLDKFSALAATLGFDELSKGNDTQLTKYIKSSPDARRVIEATLRYAFDQLVEIGYERINSQITILCRDKEDTEDVAYRGQESRRLRFAHAKKGNKIDLLDSRIKEEQETVAKNAPVYLAAWGKLFPVGPRIKVWRTRVAEAGEDSVALALVARDLRNKIVDEIDKRAKDYSNEAQISAVNLGISPDEASEDVSGYWSRITSPLSIPAKLAALEELQAYADQKLTDAFSLNLELRDQLTVNDHDVTLGFENTYAKASTPDQKARITRDLFKDVLELTNALKELYKRGLREVLQDTDLQIDINIDRIMEELDRCSLKDQIQIMIAGKLPPQS